MADKFSPEQMETIDRDNRNMAASGSNVDPLSTILNDLYATIDAGNIGVTAAAKDVDAIAKDGGTFAYNDTSSAGLSFYLDAGRLMNAGTLVEVSAGAVTLTNGANNYVEVSPAGVVSTNTTAFTAGSMPLYLVLTSGGMIVTVTKKKPLLSIVGAGSVNASRLASTQRYSMLEARLGTISATGSYSVILPPTAGTISAIRLQVNTSVTANDTNYWTLSAVNKNADGAGTTALLAATDANTTKATGGSGLTSYVPRALTLHGTGANLTTVGATTVVFTATKAASAADLVDAVLQIETTDG